jgi:cytochrome b6-f complex iron-sulfur subunit
MHLMDPDSLTAKTRSSEETLSRRDFLLRSVWKVLGVVAAIEVLGMIATFFFSGKRGPATEPKQLLEAGPMESFAVNTVSAFMGGRFYLARLADGGFIAISLRCTHLGCSVSWEEKKNRFICPCHSSAFDIGGEVLNPPAARALDYYPVLIENGVVKVDIGNLRERKTFRKDQLTYAQ